MMLYLLTGIKIFSFNLIIIIFMNSNRGVPIQKNFYTMLFRKILTNFFFNTKHQIYKKFFNEKKRPKKESSCPNFF
jgi:hypothetical protein